MAVKTDKVKDFDAFFAEATDKGPEFKLFGKNETLSPSLPAMLIVKLTRAQRQYGDHANMPEGEQFELAYSIFGEERVMEWAEKGLTVDQLGELIKWAMEQYTGKQGKKKGRA